MIDCVETEYRSNKIIELYQRIKNLKGDCKKKEIFLKNDDGSLITTDEELARKWANYFDKREIFPLSRKTKNYQLYRSPSLEVKSSNRYKS